MCFGLFAGALLDFLVKRKQLQQAQGLVIRYILVPYLDFALTLSPFLTLSGVEGKMLGLHLCGKVLRSLLRRGFHLPM